MTTLIWDSPESKNYEQGISKGVLYPDSGSGVVWNGLISVDETMVGDDDTSYYFDGIRYLNLLANRDFQCSITAYSAPVEFGPCMGEIQARPGLILTRQAKTRFGLSYRSELPGEDGYRLHLIWNAKASQTARGYATIDDSVNPTQFSWQIDAVPVPSSLFRPSAHVVLDSTMVDLESLENVLYGSETGDAYLPDLEEVIHLLGESIYKIVPNSETGFNTLETAADGDVYGVITEGLYQKTDDTRLVETSTGGFYDLED